MAKRQFPEITPTGRSFKPGQVPQTTFTSQNGATTFVQFGGRFVNCELQLTFNNIQDLEAREILDHYASVVGDDYVTFSSSRGLGGMASTLIGSIETGSELLRYRYKEPPALRSVYPGVSTVQCTFTGFLYGV